MDKSLKHFNFVKAASMYKIILAQKFKPQDFNVQLSETMESNGAVLS